MPAATMITGTDKYTEFEERRYNLRVLSCKDAISPPPDSRPQFEWLVALEGTEDPDTGREIAIKMWTSAVWGESAEKPSHLYLVMRALGGHQVTLAYFEALDFPDLVGLRGSAMVKLNAKGYPTVDKETFKPIGGAAPKNQATLPQAAPPAAPRRPTPPAPRPAANLRSEDQAAELLQLARAAEPPLDDAAVESWIAESYPGKTLATISPDEATALIVALGVPF